MRDPFSWSFPVLWLFGITVRVHILFILISVSLILRTIIQAPPSASMIWVDVALIFVGMFFVAVLLHEYGHCFAARREGGEATDILMWPLGGLASVEIPHSWRAHWNVTFAGPAVNLLLCFVCAGGMFIGSYLPNPNPFGSVMYPETYNWREARWEITKKPEDRRYFKAGTTEEISGQPAIIKEEITKKEEIYIIKDQKLHPANENLTVGRSPVWVTWVARFFWVNWFLFLFNLLPAFPMDGGRLLQALLWRRSDDYRESNNHAILVSKITTLPLIIVAFVFNDAMLFALVVFIWFVCLRQQFSMEMGAEGDSPYGDFSQGYSSYGRVEEEETAPPKPKKPGLIRRWLQARAERRRQREESQRIADEKRLDELLDKIAHQGKESLTSEERRFLDRMSKRYGNHSP